MTIQEQIKQFREPNKGARDFALLARTLLKYGTFDRIERAIKNKEIGGPLADIFKYAGQDSLSRRDIFAHAVPGYNPENGFFKSAGIETKTLTDFRKKSAQNPQSMAVDTALLAYEVAQNGVIGSLENSGAFDGMLSSMRPLPLGTAVSGYVSTAATAYSLGERDMKPISKLGITASNSDPVKIAILLEFTQELVRFGGPGALQLIQDQMTKAVAKETDAKFISIITSGVSNATTTGSTATGMTADLHYLLSTVQLDQSSKPFFVSNATVYKNFMPTNDRGTRSFPDLNWPRGTALGIPWLITDAITSGTVYLVDAARLGGNGGEFRLDQGTEYTTQGDSVPDSPAGAATPFKSIWQLNIVGLRIERYIVVEKIDPNCVAGITSSSSYAGGDSPP
jgi:hypothetical protein